MIEYIIKIYLMSILSIIFHEFGHIIAAKIIKADIRKICIGYDKLGISIGKIHISPLILSAYIESELNVDNKYKLTLYFVAGILVNLSVIIYIFFFVNISIISAWAILINMSQILISIIPCKKDSDINQLLIELNK